MSMHSRGASVLGQSAHFENGKHFRLPKTEGMGVAGISK